MEDKTFLGTGWSFPPEFDKSTYSTVMSSNEENIRDGLGVLFSTSPGERINCYDFGCTVRKFVFESMDVTTQTLLTEEIRKSVILFEPRITLDSIQLEMDQPNGIMFIKLEYTICQTNKRSNMVYPFYLNEGTDITI